MHRTCCGIALAAVVIAPTVASADPTQVGAFFGPRIFSQDSLLGYIDDAPAHPMLDNAIAVGFRVARPFLPWLVPELELAFAPTDTDNAGGAKPVSVLWMEPRLQLRFELAPERRFMPFVVVGAGAPIALSSARKTFDSGILGEGYLGGGLRFDSHKKFLVRLDARVSLLPGVDRYIGAEIDINVGIEFQLGKRPVRTVTPLSPVADRDSDGIADATDQCIDRPEDADGFEDLDGCPDIDNDLDRVLDIADRCATVPETYNGFADDDGCPDMLPADVDSLRGTIEGLIYAEGETVVRDSAQPSLQKIAKIMADQPTIKVQLLGHTDDREANQFAPTGAGAPPADLAELAIDLSTGRAEAVRQALAALGVAASRIEILGKGFEEPVAENDKPKGRLANRRVEIKLYVPPR